MCENAYGMLKGRFRILYKKTECQLFNLKYIVMASLILHNLCIDVKDSCLPPWRLHVKNISLIRDQVEKREDINLSDANRSRISNWLWNNQLYKGWFAGILKRYNNSGYRSPHTRILDAKSVL